MYREYRAMTVTEAVTLCCKLKDAFFIVLLIIARYVVYFEQRTNYYASSLDRDMAARHRARATVIQILKVEIIPASKCRRPNMKQLFVSYKCSEGFACFTFPNCNFISTNL